MAGVEAREKLTQLTRLALAHLRNNRAINHYMAMATAFIKLNFCQISLPVAFAVV